ncbi:MAG: hypothetical protein K0U79_15150 [Gammaproteobacteria bacterium]|nr:hypothetical protein [Gammaproteobacteria bacterium]
MSEAKNLHVAKEIRSIFHDDRDRALRLVSKTLSRKAAEGRALSPADADVYRSRFTLLINLKSVHTRIISIRSRLDELEALLLEADDSVDKRLKALEARIDAGTK